MPRMGEPREGDVPKRVGDEPGSGVFRLQENNPGDLLGVVFLLVGIGFVGVVSREGVERERCIISGLVNRAELRSRFVALSGCGLSSRSRGGVDLIPNFAWSSSMAGEPSRLRAPDDFIPPGLPGALVGVFVGVVGVFGFRQCSKQSGQLGRPRRSTMGCALTSLWHDVQRKQRRCHTRPALSMNPPSLANPSTTRPQDAQSPLDPPFVV